jgi:hypothetical protein
VVAAGRVSLQRQIWRELVVLVGEVEVALPIHPVELLLVLFLGQRIQAAAAVAAGVQVAPALSSSDTPTALRLLHLQRGHLSFTKQMDTGYTGLLVLVRLHSEVSHGTFRTA